MNKMNCTIFSFIFFLSLSSMAFSDITSSITSLAARNAEGYLAPLGTMMGSSMNSGFYRKASPHKILGFDITLDIAIGLPPPGQTTYDFIIPDDSIGYSFPFKFPKSYLATTQSNLLGNIPDANTTDSFNDDGLFEDIPIGFNLPLNMLLAVDDTKPAQNILGDSTTIPLEFDFGVAGTELTNQVIDGTWAVAKTLPGIGKDYDVWLNGIEGGTLITTIPAAFDDSTTFRTGFGEGTNIDSTLKSTLEEMNISLPIPGGFGHYFPGLPLPLAQISIGLPFHTEITARGLPMAITMPNLGSLKYGGFGGKIGISEYLSDILYSPEKDAIEFSDSNLVYIIKTPPSKINSSDVDNAISTLRLNEINVNEIDSLNYLFLQGDMTAVLKIQNLVRDAQLQLENQQIKKKKKKKFPIDLALGYYTNDIILDLEGQTPLKMNSTNRMIALQAGKTLNLPSFLAFLGGVGIYGGLGFESSSLSMNYSFVNPISIGDETNTKEDIEIALDIPGDNKFRSLIGARVRILFVDAYVDYNMGNSNNAINAGIGITIR